MANSDWRQLEVTQKQRARLKWWAKKLKLPEPTPRTRGEASQIMDAWEAEHDDLIEEWEAEKDKIREREELKAEQREEREMKTMELDCLADDMQDWRDSYGCRTIPKAVAKRVIKAIGLRRDKENIRHFADRFFSELRRTEPQLFAPKKLGRRSQSGCLSVIVLGIMIFLFICAAITGLRH
jgi:hypothetical protein